MRYFTLTFRAICCSCEVHFIEAKNPYEVGRGEEVQSDNPPRPGVMHFRDMEWHMKVCAVEAKKPANISFLEIPPDRCASGRAKRKSIAFREKKTTLLEIIIRNSKFLRSRVVRNRLNYESARKQRENDYHSLGIFPQN